MGRFNQKVPVEVTGFSALTSNAQASDVVRPGGFNEFARGMIFGTYTPASGSTKLILTIDQRVPGSFGFHRTANVTISGGTKTINRSEFEHTASAESTFCFSFEAMGTEFQINANEDSAAGGSLLMWIVFDEQTSIN